MISRILALLVGGPVRAVAIGGLVIVPPVVCFVLALGWLGAGLIAAGVVGAAVWLARRQWWGRPW